MTVEQKTSDIPDAIAILGGTGAMGRGLAIRWARAGRMVILGSRDQEKARGAALTIAASCPDARVEVATNVEAATRADLTVLTVPFAHQEPILLEVRDALAGKILVDVTVPIRPPRVDVVNLPPGGSAARRAQELLGDRVRVVSAFQNASAQHLAADHELDCDILVTGDDAAARAVVVALAELAGMRAWHAGPLVNSVAAESMTAVLIHINRTYKIAGAGIRITGSKKSGGTGGAK